jgi:hypothetical protein
VPKVEDQKFKRVMIEEDSEEEEEETEAPAPTVAETKKPLIQEIEKPKEDFISKKDSNYSQFDLTTKPTEEEKI